MQKRKLSPSSISKSGWLNISILIILTSHFSAKCISLWGKLLNCHQSRKYQLIFSPVEVRCPWSDHHWSTGCTCLLWEQLSGRNVAFIIKAHSAQIRFKRHRVASWCLEMDDRLSCKSFTSEPVQPNRKNKEKQKEGFPQNNVVSNLLTALMPPPREKAIGFLKNTHYVVSEEQAIAHFHLLTKSTRFVCVCAHHWNLNRWNLHSVTGAKRWASFYKCRAQADSQHRRRGFGQRPSDGPASPLLIPLIWMSNP